MLKKKTALIIVTLLSAAFIAGCNKTSGDESADSKAKKVIAVVDGTTINNAAFDAYERQRSKARQAPSSPSERKAIIDEMVNLELIYQEGMRLGLDKKPEIAAEIENQKRNILASVTVQSHMETVKVTEEAMRKEYDSHMGKMTSKEFNARHILVDTEDEAKALIAQLGKGANFAKLAKAKSKDKGSAVNGGDLSWFEAGQMVQPFGDAIKAMEKGTYSKAPVQSQFGWHVIKLEDTREIKPPAFEKVMDNMRNILQNKEIETYLASLKSKAKIKITGEEKSTEKADVNKIDPKADK